MNDTKNNQTAVDETELEVAKTEAKNSTDVYTHKLLRPLSFERDTFKELTFDWGTLTAEDSIAIEGELALNGKAVIVPEFSGDFLLRMAARACTTRGENGKRLGIDAFLKLSLPDYNRIRGRARGFLLRLEP